MLMGYSDKTTEGEGKSWGAGGRAGRRGGEDLRRFQMDGDTRDARGRRRKRRDYNNEEGAIRFPDAIYPHRSIGA